MTPHSSSRRTLDLAPLLRRASLVLAIAGALVASGVRAKAQEAGRFLGREEIRLLGLGMEVTPPHQSVPKDVATIVSTFLHLPPSQSGDVSPFPPGTVLKGTLRGPSLTAPLALTAAPNSQFNIPPLSVPGTHTLDDIRLEVDGQVLMRGTPESVVIDVLEKILVTQVTTRPLTAQEIRDKGIVFDKSSFQAYNFTAAFAVKDNVVQLSFPVILPRIDQQGTGPTDQIVTLPTIQAAQPANLATIIPDTLRIQRAIPNLSVVGFRLELKQQGDRELVAPPIPGVVVFPGQIGFLNQFFSALLMVGNAAPAGSGLTVANLQGEILLPAGRSGVVGASDAPLRMATTSNGSSQPVQAVAQAGPDGRTGTADDINTIAPGDTATAEYLVEGRREGTHTVEFAITGTLLGLPGGPVTISGRAAGAILVRNPSFTLTFTHPDTVQVGEPYTLDVTVTNTSPSIANFVSVALSPQHVSGATIVGESSQTIETLAPQDSATLSFSLVSQVTGRVFAATLDGDENVNGRFMTKTGVGELNVAVSPDSLVLPAEANSLPVGLRKAALGLLGKAWSVATAPPAGVPADVTRFSRKIVYDRAIEVAEAGFRHTLHEPLATSATHLLFDFTGNNYGRIAVREPNAGERDFVESDYLAFDELRRRSVRGDVFAAAVGAVLAPELSARGAATFHRDIAEQVSWRPASLSVLASTEGGGPLPVRLVLVDAAGRATGRVDAAGKIEKAIPFSDLVEMTSAGGSTSASLAMIASVTQGAYRIIVEPRAGVPAAPFTISLVYPDASGKLRQVVFDGVTNTSVPTLSFAASDPWRVTFEAAGGGAPTPVMPSTSTAIVEPAPTVIGVVQQKNADIVTICVGPPPIQAAAGRIVAVLFNKDMPPAALDDNVATGLIAHYGLADNQVVGVALQPGRRIALLALRDPVGPYVPRSITFIGIDDGRGNTLSEQAVPIEATVDKGGVVTGKVMQADGTPIPGADVRLVYTAAAGGCSAVTISSRMAAADGSFSWDYVAHLDSPAFNRAYAFDAAAGDVRTVDFGLQRDGQHLNLNVVFLGRGTFAGRLLDEAGKPLEGGAVRLTSLTDLSQVFGATSDADGRFTVARLPVGNVLIEAVHGGSNARATRTERIPFAGATIARDIVLIKEVITDVTVKYGRLSGRVLLSDGASAVAGVPVVVYYQNGSQPSVFCPDGPSVRECAVATATTDQAGAFAFAKIAAGQHRVVSFKDATLQQGEARVLLPADGATEFNLLLAQGLATVHGIVLDAVGQPVPGASVGGGLSLTTTGPDGRFVLTDVPVGKRDIVAVSDALGTQGSATIDIVQAGQDVNVTVVLSAVAGIAGRVFEADKVTPVAGVSVYLFTRGDVAISVIASTVTDGDGRYTFSKLPLDATYWLSAFRPDFSDGNVVPAPLRFNNQVLRGDIMFRGRGGIMGTAKNADGTAPLAATVGVSGDRVVIGGGLVGVGFEHVKNFAITQTNAATGAFAFSNVFVGAFGLEAVGPFSPDPIHAEGSIPAHGATVQVDLRLTATSKITGTVLLPDGVTPAGKDVNVTFKSDAFRTICSIEGSKTVCVDVAQGIQAEHAVTDDAGQFVIPLVNPGRFTLTAERTDGLSGQIRGQVGPGQTGEFSIRLLKQATVTINVRRNDTVTPVPNARVEIQQLTYPQKKLVRSVVGNGPLVVSGEDGFSEGDLVVTATDPSNGFAGRATGRITSTDTAVVINVFLFDASGSVSGTVFRSDHLTPVPNADVVISNDKGPLAFAQSDANGYYTADVIPRGLFKVDVFEPATGRLAFASGQVTLDHEAVLLNIVQAAVGEVTGRVLTAGTLAPLKLWTVTLFQLAPSGRSLPPLSATTGVDGGFAFPGASQGAFTLNAQRYPLYALPAQGQIREEGDVVDIPIVVTVPTPEFGRLEGVVVNSAGIPVANAQVRICTGACNSPSAGYQEFSVTATADGSFAIDQIRVGRLEILAKAATGSQAGRATAQLAFDGDSTHVTVLLLTSARVTGTARLFNGSPASGVRVELSGNPSSGCPGRCVAFAGSDGRFDFIDVPATTVTVTATDPVNGRSGVVVANVTSGATTDVTVVLQPSAALTGRVLTASSAPAASVVAELQSGLFGGNGKAFVTSDAAGVFTFSGLAPGTYVLTLTDPLGPGVARRILQLTGDLALGDIVLDEAGPAVASVTPVPSALAVPLAQHVRLVMSEPLDPASLTPGSVVLSGLSGVVLSTVALSDNDSVITLTPLAPLAEATRYALQLTGLRDRVGKLLAPAFTSAFTTVDLTAPTTLNVSPTPNATGVTINTTVRLAYSEAIDAARFRGPPVVLSKNGTSIDGRLDFALGNTVVVFTPSRPLEVGARYDVVALAAFDLAGNEQQHGHVFSFTTSTLTPPVIVSLTAASPTVIEGTSAAVTADVGQADIAVVDFYLNDVPAFAGRTRPFRITFDATSAVGRPGDRIKVSAIATDTSGLRGTTPVVTFIDVIADHAPAAVITAPAEGVNVHNGERVTVTIRGTDDVGVAQIAYRPGTGRPQDAASHAITPAASDRIETFAFTVPETLAPGTTIEIAATSVDTKGQQTQAIPVHLMVLDAAPPAVSITGTSSGTLVRPGSDTVAVVAATDAGGVASIHFRATGVVTFDETRAIDPAQPSVAASFSLHVPGTAGPTDTIRLEATAFDRAGNSKDADAVILSITDLAAPRVTLHTASGRTDAIIGSTVGVIVNAEDEIGVTRIDLRGSGAFTLADGRSIAPPRGSVAEQFDLAVPAGAQPDQILTVEAIARDIYGNVSAPVALSLTLRSLADVALPPSVILLAGETVTVPVVLSTAAPASGISVKLVSGNANIAGVTSPVTFAAGESSGQATISGVAGGSTAVTASILGDDRAAMTVTVQGAVVSGTVYDSQFHPVAGVQVSVTAGTTIETVTTDGAGRYQVVSDLGSFVTDVTVRAFDPENKRLGVATGNLNAPLGFAHLDVILFSVGSITGQVQLPNGVTPAPAGVTVKRLAQNGELLDTTFTHEDGTYSLDLVPLGTYLLEASDQAGNRGRASATIDQGGQQLTVPIKYLGRGAVIGTVRNGVNQPVATAHVRLSSSSIFGTALDLERNVLPDGTFRFDNVFVGVVSVQATDQASGLAGVATGNLTQDGQVLVADVTLDSYGSVQGIVYRADGTTTVPGAQVTLTSTTRSLFTLTDGQGHYQFAAVPLGAFTIGARHEATRGIGRATGVVTAQGQAVTTDVAMFPQGTVVATVVHAAGDPAPGASVTIQATRPFAFDAFTATADGNGVAILENVLAGTFSLTARSGPLSGTAEGTLAAGGVVNVTVSLQPTGSIAGTVFLTDGVTPAQAGTVTISTFQLSRTVDIAADGSYRIDGLPLQSFTATVKDGTGVPRAVRTVQLTTGGQTLTQNFAFTPIGRVAGRVINPGGSSASSMIVTLRSLNADFGGFRSTTTDGGGFYEFAGVYKGQVVVTAANAAAGLLGEVTGALNTEGQTVTLDIQLAANAVRFPVTRADASNYPYDVQPDGSIYAGMNGVFYGIYPATGGEFLLDIVSGGVPTRFAGNEIGTTELGGNQLVTRQTGIAGLNVTRKVFVPRSHFARYLELLSNPTASPITVSVRIQHLTSGRPPVTLATSSGDTSLNVSDAASADRWIATSIYDDLDPFDGGYYPSLAWNYDGAGARRRVTTATIGVASTLGGGQGAKLTYEWSDVTVPAGGVVGLMHYGVQQTSRAAARASAERLDLVPPEALEGLSPAEIAAIENFNIPANGISQAPPLPPLTGAISGQVFEADGTTTIDSAFKALRIKSSVPVFARTYFANALNQGKYSLATGSDVVNNGANTGFVAIPVAPFTVTGRHPRTQVNGPTITGAFAPGETTTVVNYTFANTAMVTGKIRRANGTIVTNTFGSTINANRTIPSGFNTTSPDVAADGSYKLFGLPAGTYQLLAHVRHQQGADVTGTAAVTIAAGEIKQVDVTLNAVGSLTGTVRDPRGTAVGNRYVTLRDPSSFNAWSANTTPEGTFLLSDIPVGTYSLEAQDYVSGLIAKIPVTILADQTITRDIFYIATGTVTGRVFGPTGALLPFQQVGLYPVAGTGGGFGATTDDQGRYTFSFMQAGEFVLTSYESNSRLLVDARGQLTTDGETQTIDLRFTGVALPTSLVDANGFQFDVESDGRLTGSLDAFKAGVNLSIFAKDNFGTVQNIGFPGRNSAYTEMGDRQLVIPQSPYNNQGPAYPAGLVLTRKIYVPQNGYFARYLDVFENRGAAPMTFDVQIHSGLLSSFSTQVLATSSGNLAFDPTDRWLITDKAATGKPVLAHVFGGPNAALPPSAVGIGFGYFNTAYGPFYRWNGFTLQPGQRVVLMHFAVQQFDLDGARASVERLQQLPPEALAGLSADDIAAIRTFVVPADGSSPLAPLTDAKETITATGRVFDQNGTTPIAGAQVTFGSATRLFGAPVSTVSDAGGNYTVTRKVVDRYLLQARHPLTQAFSPDITDAVGAGQTTLFRNIVFSGTGTLRGVVRTQVGTPIGGGSVIVNGAALTFPISTSVAADGTYSVSGLPPSTYSATASFSTRSTTVDNIVVTAGGTTIQDIIVLADASLLVDVHDAFGARVQFAQVYVQLGLDGGYVYGQINGGPVTITDVTEGTFTVLAYSQQGDFIAQAKGTVTAADQGRQIEVDLRPSQAGHLTGHVFAGDGQSGIPYVSVSAIDVASEQTAASATTDASGSFSIPLANHGTQGLKVIAAGPAGDGVAEKLVSFTTLGQTLNVDLTLPLALVHGSVFLADGVTPANQTQQTQVEVGQGSAQGYVSRQNPELTGHTFVAYLAAGAFTIRASAAPTYAGASVSGTVTDVSVTQSLSILLPPTATITGVVRDSIGAPIPFTSVVVSTSGGSRDQDVSGATDADGEYRFESIPLGVFSVQACQSEGICGTASGALSVPDQGVTANVTMPTTGTVEGRALRTDGVTLMSRQFDYVHLTVGNAGPLNQGVYISTAGTGRYTAVTPLGTVTAATPGSGEPALATGTLTTASTLTLDLIAGVGGAVSGYMSPPDGADNFAYRSTCDGSIWGGEDLTPYYHAYTLRVDGTRFGCGEVAISEANGQQIAYGPMTMAGLEVTRRVFVPVAGGFARYQETFTNAGATPISVDVLVESAWSGAAGLFTAPAATNLTFAVTADGSNGASGRAAAAHVFAGPGAATTPAAVEFQPFVGPSLYRFRITVPAGATVTLLHFTVQRAGDDAAGARALAESLVNLTDPNALAAMTAEEKARVINFKIQ